MPCREDWCLTREQVDRINSAMDSERLCRDRLGECRGRLKAQAKAPDGVGTAVVWIVAGAAFVAGVLLGFSGSELLRK